MNIPSESEWTEISLLIRAFDKMTDQDRSKRIEALRTDKNVAPNVSSMVATHFFAPNIAVEISPVFPGFSIKRELDFGGMDAYTSRSRKFRDEMLPSR